MNDILNITDIRVNGNPRNYPYIDSQNPYISWHAESKTENSTQSTYRVEVLDSAGNTVFDTGIVKSEKNYVRYSGDPLKSGRTYAAVVSITNNLGIESGRSFAYKFHTGMLNDSDWRANWINIPDSNDFPALYRRKFSVLEGLQKATAYISSRSIYNCEINGRKLDPSSAVKNSVMISDKVDYYRIYDISSYIEPGENVIGFAVAPNKFDGKKDILFQLEIFYEGNRKQYVISDSRVKSSYGPWSYADISKGEKYVASAERDNWSMPTYDDLSWASVNVSDNRNPLILDPYQGMKKLNEIKPVRKFETPAKQTVWDFGKIITGRINVSLSAPKGTSVRFDYAETLDKNGNFVGGSWGENSEQSDIYTYKGREREFYEPQLTYHGFRYVRILYPSDLFIRIHDVKAVVIGTDITDGCFFKCSDEGLNQLFENVKNTFSVLCCDLPFSSMLERTGRGDDIYLSTVPMLTVRDYSSLIRRYLFSLLYIQDEKGIIPYKSPFIPSERSNENSVYHSISSSGSSDSCALIPELLAEWNNDIKTSEKMYDCAEKWFDYILNNKSFSFGDRDSFSGYGHTMSEARKDSAAFCDIYRILCCKALSEMSELTGKENKYSALLDNLKNGFVKKYVCSSGKLKHCSLSVYALALYHDLIPEDIALKTCDILADKVKKYSFGKEGMACIFRALSRYGHVSEAYDMLLKKEYPSFGYELENGATTVWDSFKNHTTNHDVTNAPYAALGSTSVCNWLVCGVSGINIFDAASKVEFRPFVCPDRRLRYSECTLVTPNGTVSSKWKLKDGQFSYEIEVPFGMTAKVYLPDGSIKENGNGKYLYECAFGGQE